MLTRMSVDGVSARVGAPNEYATRSRTASPSHEATAPPTRARRTSDRVSGVATLAACIKPPPPDLDCNQVSFRRFQVRQPDPHGFDADRDGVGCEAN